MIEKIIKISREAGEILKEGFRKNFEIEFKTNEKNLVTEYDRKSEELIKNFISKNFPSHGVLAEESGATNKEAEYLWVIDPLDGTSNFAHKLPIFSVSIGVQRKGEIIAGVVYDVMRDVIYSAEKGSGAYANGKVIKPSNNDNISRSFLVTGFPYHVAENPSGVIEKFEAFIKNARAVRRLGSAAIDFCYVAEGVFDGFWEVYLSPWDICAGKLIVEESGGKVTDFIGNEIDIFNTQILASNGFLHEKMIKILKEN